MKHSFARCFALALTACLAAGTLPAANADAARFDAALREDRLALTRVELPSPYAQPSSLSLSPDGTRVLLMTDDGLYRYRLADGTAERLTPQIGDSGLTQKELDSLFAKPEATAIDWSPDGGLLFSFPSAVLLQNRLNANIWYAKEGEDDAVPLFSFPEDYQPFGSYDDPSMIPFLAALDGPDHMDVAMMEPWLKSTAREREVVYCRRNLRTGEEEQIGSLPIDLQAGRLTKLWRMPGRLTTTFSARSGPEDGAGVIVFGKDGAVRFAPRLSDDTPSWRALLWNAALIDARDDAAILYQPAYEQFSKGYRNPPLVLEVSMDERGQVSFGGRLALAVDAAADRRLARVPPVPMKDADASQILPYNAAFSPDGAYLLLAALVEGEPCLYLLNRDTGECGHVALPKFPRDAGSPLRFSYAATQYSLRGIEWAEGNRLLLYDEASAHLYALGI